MTRSHHHHAEHRGQSSARRSLSRRGFLSGCSTAIAALAGSRFNSLVFAGEPSESDEILLVVFLRGGMDGLNLLPPIDGPDRGYYESARPSLAVPTSGGGAAIDLGGQFGLHPAASPLHGLFQDNRLAFVQGVGQPEPNRSHFDAMQYIELGTPGDKSTLDGWLTRHVQSASNLPRGATMPRIAVGNLQPTSLRGSLDVLAMEDTETFNLDAGPWQWRGPQRLALRRIYESGTSLTHMTGLQSLNAVDIVELGVAGTYVPGNGAVYPDDEFGDHLQVVAQLLKLDLGLQVATLDLGGWDTHEGQGVSATSRFGGLVSSLSAGLEALYTDLDGAGAANYTQRLTVVVQSEFGRRFEQNADNGTDHGYGNLMMLLGGNVIGGIHGQFPGLHADQLFEGEDLAVTADYRQVLSEVLIRRLGNPHLGVIFPGYMGYSPLGVVNGADLPPIYGDTTLFADGFESGAMTDWSTSST